MIRLRIADSAEDSYNFLTVKQNTMALQQDILLLQSEYKRAKRCADLLAHRITVEEVGIESVKNALDAALYIARFNARVDKLIDQMYETCENRFMIDRVRLMKIMKSSSPTRTGV